MSSLTIENFWKRRLPVERAPAAPLLQGWSFVDDGLATFTEAPLSLSVELSSEADAENSTLLIVSAPGAVGKTTLAQQIAFATGAVYLDLSKAEPVGANTLSGGLVRSNLYENWKAQTTAVLIDGLDEARLRVTQEAFEAFLRDVVDISKDRSVPTVLFGRTGAVEHTWLFLSDSEIEPTVLEIGYYDPKASVEFALQQLRATRSDRAHEDVDRKVLKLLLDRLRVQTESDGDRFAGYAPVLQAVAEFVAREGNPQALIARLEEGAQPVTLRTVVSSILDREHGKLKSISLEQTDLIEQLYLPDEQLNRLVARIYGVPVPELPAMRPNDTQTYADALESWVAEHPFLDGGLGTSSAVFEAAIVSRALRYPPSRQQAVQGELVRGAKANPFLSEFYMTENSSLDGTHLPPEHIGIIYASLRARLSLGDAASLVMEGVEDGDEEDALRAEVEITFARHGVAQPRVLHFDSEQAGSVRLGAHVEDVEVIAPNSQVEIGPGPEAVLVAPISIQCEKLVLATEKVIVECPSGHETAAVFLQADVFDGAQMTSVPVLRGDVSLAAAWPGVRGHPWTGFATEPPSVDDPRVEEALRRFRRFVTAFRSHGQGGLARYKHKIEHTRMTKGTGQVVLDQMLEEGILSLKNTMYFLDPDQLSAKTGTNYVDCNSRRFGTKAVAFAKRALDARN